MSLMKSSPAVPAFLSVAVMLPPLSRVGRHGSGGIKRVVTTTRAEEFLTPFLLGRRLSTAVFFASFLPAVTTANDGQDCNEGVKDYGSSFANFV